VDTAVRRVIVGGAGEVGWVEVPAFGVDELEELRPAEDATDASVGPQLAYVVAGRRAQLGLGDTVCLLGAADKRI
jgi:hypothetical protein